MQWNPLRGRHKRRIARQPSRPAGRRLEIESLEARLAPSVNVLTYHNDLASTGQNLGETQLTRSNVNVASFGKLFQVPVDGQVYAQPLTMTGVNITTGPNAGVHDVVFVATEHDSLYAIDATSAGPNGNGLVLWQRSFLTLDSNDSLPGATSISTVSSTDNGAVDITPEVGITGTPVIDPATNTLYVIAETKEVVQGAAHFTERLHAINIADGTDRVAPFLIGDTIGNTATNTYTNSSPIFVNGTGDGNDAQGHVYFNVLRQYQRAGLSLVNGVLYAGWGSVGDTIPYHGWVAGFDPGTLQLRGVFNTTPNGGLGGIWQAGGRLASDAQGNLYFETGNGTFDGSNGNSGATPTSGTVTGLDANGFPINGDYGDSFVKIGVDPSTGPTNQNKNGWGLKVLDYFTPFDQQYMQGADRDLGSGAVTLLPDSAGSASAPHLMVGSGKLGTLYLINRDNMGKFGTQDNIVQSVVGQLSGSFDTPAYYNGTIYYGGQGENAKTFTIANGVLSSTPTSLSPDTFSWPGSTASISANGNSDGIVWNVDRGSGQLRAYSSDTYAAELYNSGQAAFNRDALGSTIKFEVPTVANGHVYAASTSNTGNSLVVYGLFQPATAIPNAPTGLTATAISASQINLSWTANDVLPNRADGYAIEMSTDGTNFTQVGTAAAHTNAYGITGLNPQKTYSFRVRAFDAIGSSSYTNVALATTTSQANALDFSVGFQGLTNLLTFNGYNTPNQLDGSRLALTDGGRSEARSVFFNTPVDITQFSTHFRFLLTNPGGDGFTFTIQNAGFGALGDIGGALGYAGIGKSVAVKFDLYDNAGEGNDSTGVYTNGAFPTTPATDLTGTIDLHSGDVMDAVLTYNGANLQVSITDTVTGRTFTQQYAVNIPSIVGGNTALVGFTGGSGASTAIQEILSWAYAPTGSTQVPAAPQGVSASGGAGQVALTWTAPIGAASYNLYRSTTSGGEGNTPIATGITGTSFTDPGLTNGTTYYYQVTAVNAAGESARSGEVSATPSASSSGAIDFSSGFSGLTNLLSFNGYGSANRVNGSRLVLTDSGLTEARSVFYSTPVSVAQFTSHFRFQLTNPNADGFTFTIQNAGPAALGGTGGALGYGGIGQSVAVKFDLYNSAGEGSDSTGLYANGASPTVPATDLTGTIDLHSGDIMDAVLTYDGASLTVAITDTVTGKTATQQYTVNIPAIVGGSTALVGFTGSTGAVVSTQEILSWTYTPSISVPVQRPGTPQSVTATAGNAQTVLNWAASTGAASYNVYRGTTAGGEGNTPIATGITGTSFTDSGLTNGTTYFYQVTAVNSAGESARSAEVSATPSAPVSTGGIDFSQGFAGRTNLLTFNGYGTASQLDGANLILTDGGRNEARSAFYSTPVNITQFSTRFRFQLTNPIGDGFTFTIQNAGANALGDTGGALGYAGIGKSVAVKFDLWDNAGEGNNSTGVYTNGASPTTPATNLTGTVNLHSGDVMEAVLTYDGKNLTVAIKDTVTGQTFSQQYAVNIASIVGGNTALVGFTGGSGGATATQEILLWTYTPSGTVPVQKPGAPQGVSTAPGNAQVALSWTASTGAASYNVYRGSTAGGEGATPIATGITGTSFTDSGLTNGTTYFYQVTAVNSAGESARSAEVSATPTGSPPVQQPGTPQSVTATAGNAQAALSWTASTGAASYNVYRGTTAGGEGNTPIATGITGTSFTDSGLTNGTTYFYQVAAVNSAGESARSAEVSAMPSAPVSTGGIDFSQGFAGRTNLLTFNGYGAASQLDGANLILTDGGRNEARSAFYSTPVNITQFSTRFRFQLTNPIGDGFTFTIQNAGANALGDIGGALGYAGIGKSVAVKFDLWDNAGEGNNSTGVYTNGAFPTTPATNLTGTVNLHSGDVMEAVLTYDGKNLTVSIKDTVTGQTFSQQYAVNIASIVGGNTALVGFTGGTGGATATQEILLWTYAPATTQPVAAAQPLALTGASGGAVSSPIVPTGLAASSYDYYALLAQQSLFDSLVQTPPLKPKAIDAIMAGYGTV